VVALVELEAGRLERLVADPERDEQRVARLAAGSEQHLHPDALGQHLNRWWAT